MSDIDEAEYNKRALAMIGRINPAKLKTRQAWVAGACNLLATEYRMKKLNDWEMSFIDTVSEVSFSNRVLSDAQFNKLNEMIRKHYPGEEYDV